MSEKYNLKYTGSEMDGLLDNANSLTGIIVMWSGAIDKIPTGWLLCDGTNGTPDLRNRFIVGAGTDYSVGNTGGSNNVVLTTAQMPSHSHTGTVSLENGGEHSHSAQGGASGSYSSAIMYDDCTRGSDRVTIKISGGAHSHTGSVSINSAGSGQAHENRPPYYALAYIMKV